MKTPDHHPDTNSQPELSLLKESSAPVFTQALPEKTTPEKPMTLLPEANQDNYERRNNNRKPPPKIAQRIVIQRMLNTIVYKIYGHRICQFLFLGIILGSVFTLWYSIEHRAKLINTTYSEFSIIGELESEILALNQVWSVEQMSEITDLVASVDSRRVFSDYRSLASWLTQKGDYAAQLDLNLSYTLGEGQSGKIDNMLEVPIYVSIKPADSSSDQLYLQILEFMRKMVSTGWYVDIQEAGMESNGDQAGGMTALLRVWVHGDTPADNRTAQTSASMDIGY